MNGDTAALCVRLLREQGQTVSTAESCTGGLVSKKITDVPGASAVFPGGVVSYAEGVKTALLSVREQTLRDHTVVSRETAREMAAGVRRLLGTDYGLSVTGLAGPDGDGIHPVGTIFIALSGPDGERCRELRLGNDRAANREQAAQELLALLADTLQ